MLLLLLVFSVFVHCAPSQKTPLLVFQGWKEKYGKVYADAEDTVRRKIFEDNLKYIQQYHNEHTHTSIDLNQYADLTHEEFLSVKTGPRIDYNGTIFSSTARKATFRNVPRNKPPASKDWRVDGVVTKVKNQGSCGACYAFASIGALEGQWALKKNTLLNLSVQQVVDCSKSSENDGCKGGRMTNTFKYILNVGGIQTDTSYPYTGKEGDCKFSTGSVAATAVDYWPRSTETITEVMLKRFVGTVGPIAAGIDASHRSLQFYTGGIYYEPACSSTNIDHGVLIVGYGKEGTHDFWLIKNSWGSDWGERGYLRLLRNYYNHCGIAKIPSYPIVE